MPKNSKWQKEYSFMYNMKEKGLDNLIEKNKSNIIKCELIGENGYGIKEIFDKIHSYLNVIEDKNHKPTGKIYTQSFIEDIKKFKNFDEKLQYIKSKTSLFDQFKSKEDIISYGNKRSKALITSMTTIAAACGTNPIPFVDIAIVSSIVGTTIIKIGKNYGYVWKNISKKDLIAICRGQLYNEEKNIEDNKKENNKTNLSKKEILNLVGETFFKGTAMICTLAFDDIIKAIWGIGTAAGSVIGAILDGGIVYKYSNNAKKYFESKCKADDGTIFFGTRCGEYENIFRKFDQFKNFELIYPTE